MQLIVSTLILTMLSALLSSTAVFADRDRPFIDEEEAPVPASVADRDATWKEAVTSLPPWPSDGDLVEFSVDNPSSRFRQYIDSKSISVGADRAVRYTLIVESQSGTRNVSFEGLRCTPKGAFKIYAYGYNGHFKKTESDWVRIQGRHRDWIHQDLHKQILCIPRGFEPRSKRDMLQAMESRAPGELGTGFLPD